VKASKQAHFLMRTKIKIYVKLLKSVELQIDSKGGFSMPPGLITKEAEEMIDYGCIFRMEAKWNHLLPQ
jgi:hypothetical protein